MKKVNNFQVAKVQPQGVAKHLFIFFPNFNLAFLIKVLLIKKSVYSYFMKMNALSNL